jgi:hypothetical protein
MKKDLFVVLAVVFLLSVPSTNAQMQPKYSTVHNSSVTWDSNGNPTIVSQFITQGYTVCGQCVPQWQHQARATQQWAGGRGSSGGTHYDQWRCVTCNLYAESDGSITAQNPADIGNLINEDDSGQVQCTQAGTFFSVTDFFDWELAYTRSKNTGTKAVLSPVPCPQGTCYDWQITAYCSAVTSPPDWNPPDALLGIQYSYLQGYYWDGINVCFRITGTGQSWVCLLPHGPALFYPIGSGLYPGNCTHNP